MIKSILKILRQYVLFLSILTAASTWAQNLDSEPVAPFPEYPDFKRPISPQRRLSLQEARKQAEEMRHRFMIATNQLRNASQDEQKNEEYIGFMEETIFLLLNSATFEARHMDEGKCYLDSLRLASWYGLGIANLRAMPRGEASSGDIVENTCFLIRHYPLGASKKEARYMAACLKEALAGNLSAKEKDRIAVATLRKYAEVRDVSPTDVWLPLALFLQILGSQGMPIMSVEEARGLELYRELQLIFRGKNQE